MPNPLNTIRKNGVYTILTPDEDGFLIGHSDGQPVAFFFSQLKKAKGYKATIGKDDHVVVKEDAEALAKELVEAGVKHAFIDAEDAKSLPDPLLLPKFLEHLAKAEATS